eukprot:CAMPEP_0177652472 /NCGR_PEP_ID=MMETSP0447-20121125/13152_1 /TAXON_ID=0 /ORGANISM="Stygamoeba regulata, Strain BSH-02190019" /LENGTH=582 /DNA_ID=CAMNT_0019155727 /DNA_START=56 /DNA_END=1804 /DNA_ORIENTATION=+
MNPTSSSLAGSQSHSQLSRIQVGNGLTVGAQVANALRARDRLQRDPFRPLLREYAALAHRLEASETRCAQLERSSASSAPSAAHSPSSGLSGSGTGGTLSSSGGPVVSNDVIIHLEQRIRQLEQELTQSYKASAENAQALLDAGRTHTALQEALTEAKADARRSDALAKVQQTRSDQLRQELEDLQSTLALLKAELGALRLELASAQQQRESALRRYEELEARWIQMKTQEAEQLNEANRLFEEVKARERKMEILQGAESSTGEARAALATTSSAVASAMRQDHTIPSRAWKILTAHRGECTAVQHNFSGSLFATTSNDKTLHLWDARTGTSRSVLHGAVQTLMGVAFSPNDELVMGVSTDNSARIWSISQGRVLHNLTGHLNKVYAGRFSGDSTRAITGGYDRSLKIWDVRRGYCLRTILCGSSCNDLDIQDNQLVVSGHMDGAVRFWDLKRGEKAHEAKEVHSKQVTCTVMSRDGQAVFSCGRDNVIHMHDTRTYQVVKTFSDSRFRSGVNWNRLGLDVNSEHLAIGGNEGEVFIFDIGTGGVIKTLDKKHVKPVSACSWSPLGGQIVSCDRSGSVVIWQ